MIISSIIIHELGHLVFGKITGYTLICFEILGIVIEKSNGKFRIKYKKKKNAGQCLMFNKNENADPVMLICGGMLFNLIFGMLFICGAVFIKVFIIRFIFITGGILNIYLVLYNAFWGSETSDGNTLKEVLYDHENVIRYNRIMQISYFLNEGKMYNDIPDGIFDTISEKTYTIKKHGRNRKKCSDSIKEEYESHVKKYREMKNGCTG